MRQTITVKKSVLGKGFRTLVVSNTDYENRTLRPYQQHIVVDHLGQNNYTITESPTGSGKSTIMLCHAAKRVKEGKKVIIATPQLGINAGFRRYTQKGFSATAGDETFKLPVGAVVESSNKKTTGVKHYLRGPSRCVHVCSYVALIMALEDEALEPILSETVILIDEAHHSSFGENRLGTLIKLCLEKCAEIHGFTATAFRTDGGELFNGEFKHFRRTLKEHYRDPYDSASYCPDFGIYVKFYQEVSKVKFDKFERNTSHLGSSKALIDAYLDEYDEHPLPTIMLVSTAKQAYSLEKAVIGRFGQKKILNLGSDDGKMLASRNPQGLKKKFKRLNAGEDFDIIIAIRLMNEGIDWPICAQTFSPRISSSLQLITQRAIGRALRLKPEEAYPNHPSPCYSRIVLFEIGIKDEDSNLCAKALFRFAIRLKALCEGLDFVEFKFRVDQDIRKVVDREKDKIKNKSNPQSIVEIVSKLYLMATKGAPITKLMEEYVRFCKGYNIKIGPIAVLEALIECGVVADGSSEILQEVFDSLSKANVKKLNNRFDKLEVLLPNIKIIGATDYVQLLSGCPDIDKTIELLREHTTTDEKSKRELLKLAKSGALKPRFKTKLGRVLYKYTNKNGKHYDSVFDAEIRKLRPDWFIDREQELLEIAKNGLPRPTGRTAVGRFLANATFKGNSRPEFDAEIRKLRPDWFHKAIKTDHEEMKCQIRELIKTDAPRPHYNTKLGKLIIRYTCKSSRAYDSELDAEIRMSKPNWKKPNRKNNKAQNMEDLLTLARNGEPRPAGGSILGNALVNYTSKRTEFDVKIRKLCPDWFKKGKMGKQNMQELLKIAETEGALRPHCKTRLGKNLFRYTCKSTSEYNQEFDEKIRQLKPEWFDIAKRRVARNKQKLLDMAKNGCPPPPDGTTLNQSLRHYTCPNSTAYDPEFTAQLCKIAPLWIVIGKKEKLLEMAKDGLPRPSYETVLGRSLIYYTSQSHNGYDPIFDTEIRKLRPDWFKKK